MARTKATARAKKGTVSGPIQKAKNAQEDSSKKEELPTVDSSVKDTEATPAENKPAKKWRKKKSKKARKAALNKEDLPTADSSAMDTEATPETKPEKALIDEVSTLPDNQS